MSNFSKIVIIVLILLSFFFIKDKYGRQISSFLENFDGLPKFESPIKGKDKEQPEVVKKPVVIPTQNDKKQEEKTIAFVYFLALDSNDNGIYKKVQREVPKDKNKLEFAIEELIKGPNLVEKSMGAYSEVPSSTKLLGIKETSSKIIIDFSSDFQYGGGTDSVYSRMMQLIKTAINNTENKKIYLYLDGKQVNMIGGEGIMITQPLSVKSLEV